MLRWTFLLFLLAAILTLVRFLIIAAREPSERRRLAVELASVPSTRRVEEALEAWRTRFGCILWINLVGIPLALLLLLIIIGEFA